MTTYLDLDLTCPNLGQAFNQNQSQDHQVGGILVSQIRDCLRARTVVSDGDGHYYFRQDGAQDTQLASVVGALAKHAGVTIIKDCPHLVTGGQDALVLPLRRFEDPVQNQAVADVQKILETVGCFQPSSLGVFERRHPSPRYLPEQHNCIRAVTNAEISMFATTAPSVFE